jgi:palmitoyltransferase
MYADGDNVPLQPIPPQKKKFDQYSYISEDDEDDYEYDDSSDEVAADRRIKTQTKTLPTTKNWNDLPDGFLDAPRKSRQGRNGSGGSGSGGSRERKDE